MYRCQECGRKFRTTGAAERASNNGCPGCGGVDIDLDLGTPRPTKPKPAQGKPADGSPGPRSLSSLFRF